MKLGRSGNSVGRRFWWNFFGIWLLRLAVTFNLASETHWCDHDGPWRRARDPKRWFVCWPRGHVAVHSLNIVGSWLGNAAWQQTKFSPTMPTTCNEKQELILKFSEKRQRILRVANDTAIAIFVSFLCHFYVIIKLIKELLNWKNTAISVSFKCHLSVILVSF